MRRTRVYIAGPISKGDLTNNIYRGTTAAKQLLNSGYAPFCPMLTCYMDGSEPSVSAGIDNPDVWYESDLSWLAASDCVLRLPGPSKGADAEVERASLLGLPVYFRIDTLLDNTPAQKYDDEEEPPGKSAFHEVLQELASLHARKAADYGSGSDPLANIRAAGELGIAPWLGAMLRANDKVHRIKEYARKGTLANEGVEDSFIDLAAYAIIALILFRGENEGRIDRMAICGITTRRQT